MRRAIVLASCLLARGAQAEDLELHPVAIRALATAPTLASSCPHDHPIVTTRTLAVGAATVAIGHDCGAADAATRLWIRTPAGAWFESPALAYQARSAASSSRLVDESLTPGTLADGASAIVHVVSTARGTPTTDFVTVVEVCRLDGPACDRVGVLCFAKGCGPLTLDHGTLTLPGGMQIHVR